MSQSEDPKLQEGKDKHCARVETQQSNAPPLLRSLAPKLAPRLPPFTIRAKSEASTTSSRGQQAARLGRTRDERCAVCFSRSCKLVSHKLHDASQKLRQHGTHQPPKRLGRDRVYSSSYSLKLAACYIFAGPRASRLDPFHSLPIPEDLDATHMQRLFHDCKLKRSGLDQGLKLSQGSSYEHRGISLSHDLAKSSVTCFIVLSLPLPSPTQYFALAYSRFLQRRRRTTRPVMQAMC